MRVDYPSDLGFVSAEDTIVPAAWRQYEAMSQSKDAAFWKKDGDMKFLAK